MAGLQEFTKKLSDDALDGVSGGRSIGNREIIPIPSFTPNETREGETTEAMHEEIRRMHKERKV